MHGKGSKRTMSPADQILKKETSLSKKTLAGITIGMALFYILSIVFCFAIHAATRKAVSNQAIQSITGISQMNKESVKNSIQNRKILLESVARRLDDRDLDRMTVEDILIGLDDLLGPFDFYTIGLMDKTQTVYLTNGEVIDGQKIQMADRVWKDEFIFSESFMPYTDGEYAINLFSCPVHDREGIRYILLASYYSKDLVDKMNVSSMEGKGDTFLLSSQGQVVVYPPHYPDGEYTALMEFLDVERMPPPQGGGDSCFVYNGDYYYAHFEELGLNDWYVMTCAKERDLFANARAISVIAYGSVGILWLVAFFAIGGTLYSMRKTRLRRTKDLYYDELLEIPNKKAISVCFKHLTPQEMDKMYLVVFDIDRFKEFNYLYGREAGDRTLKYIVRVIQEVEPNAFLFRYVSDCYLTMDTCGSDEEYAAKIQLVLDRFKQDIKAGVIPPFSISAGVRKIQPGEPLGEIISDAMVARETVKGNHMRHCAFYDEKIRNRRMRFVEMESGFSAALRNREFQVYYQPKYDMGSGRMVGAEALARWIKPDGTIISPGEFIPCYEASKQISQLDEYILGEVCRQVKEMEEKGLKVVPVSVNLSRVHLSRPELLPRIEAIVKESGVNPANISFEITESALLEENIPLKTIANRLRALGSRVEMDDYGIGASGPKALASQCFDVVKLDKSFVDDIGNNQVEAVIESTINLARKLGLKVLAEGVEQQYQADRLMELGCYHAQGFYYSRPLPRREYEKQLAKNK